MKNFKFTKPAYIHYLNILFELKKTKKRYFKLIRNEKKKTDKDDGILEIFENRVETCNQIIKFLNKFYKGAYSDIFVLYDTVEG